MFTHHCFIMTMSTIMSFSAFAAPTTELPPAPSAYTYIVVKYPATPISPPKKKKITKKITPRASSVRPGTVAPPPPPPPPAFSTTRGRSPFSVDRVQSEEGKK